MKTRSIKTGLWLGAAAITLAIIPLGCTSEGPAVNAQTSSTGMANACINPTDIKKQTIVSDQEIRFELRNNEVWVNKLEHACHGLNFRQGFSWGVHGTLVCSNQQTIFVKDEGTPCLLGEFSRVPASPS